MSANIPMTPNKAPPQSGAVIHHQLQSITWHSFRTRKTKKSTPPKLIVCTETFCLSDIFNLFLIVCTISQSAV